MLPPQPVAIDRARIDRQIRELALEHAGGELNDDVYLVAPEGLAAVARRAHGANYGRPIWPASDRVATSPQRVGPARRRTRGESR